MTFQANELVFEIQKLRVLLCGCFQREVLKVEEWGRKVAFAGVRKEHHNVFVFISRFGGYLKSGKGGGHRTKYR